MAIPDPPIRLALCTTEFRFGGAEQRLAELALHLRPLGFAVEAYSLGCRPQDGERSLVPRLEAAGITVHCLGGRSLASAPAVVRRLANELRRQQAEILLSFLFHANFIGRLAARWAGVPRVACAIRVAERHSKWHLLLDRWTSRLVDEYVAVSESVAQFSREEAGLPADRLTVVPNGIDLSRFDQAAPADLTALGITPARKAVTFVGRLEPQKGLVEFLAAAPVWLEVLPDHDLLLVGEGPLRRELEVQMRRCGLAGRVHLAGWRSDVPGILKGSDLLVLPSRWEGMPNAVLEAMACGLPVAAANVEGVSELLGPAAEEQTAPIGDNQALAERIIAIGSNAALAARLGGENRQRAERHFSLDAMVAAYAELLRRLVGR